MVGSCVMCQVNLTRTPTYSHVFTFNFDTTVQVSSKDLCYAGATSEKRVSWFCSHQRSVHGRPITVDEVDVCLGQSAMVKEVHGLLHHQSRFGVCLKEDFVPHVEGSHEL